MPVTVEARDAGHPEAQNHVGVERLREAVYGSIVMLSVLAVLSAGIIARVPAGLIAVAGLTVVEGRISAVDLILDPDKLAVLTID